VDRRRFLLISVGGAFAAPRDAKAQQAGKMYRIGFLSGHRSQGHEALRLLPEVLAEMGYSEGRNIAIDWRWGEGAVNRLPLLAAELVRIPVDALIPFGNEATLAAMKATTAVPIVMVGASNPVELRFIESLSRPGGNVTGTAYNPTEVAGKLVEVLKEGFPQTSRISVLWNPTMPGLLAYKPDLDRAAAALGVTVHYADIRQREDLNAALHGVRSANSSALYIVNDSVVGSLQGDILAFIGRTRLPAIYTARRWVDAGGLMYYGPNLRVLWRRTATYIDRVLKGARPTELPVEQPAIFELIINLRTAKALGLTIPPSLLLRADHVIE
jgi:putative tryptophan/tyrosine transport system substrate-binding protein